ncbi:MAG: DUF3108 domain-containing protein [Chloracidobacterium sp.]|nr:DUF3108 domain-containing protein [Chloracidobacterium sp.]MDW8218015.1 DUF3108 domain-containing protein [Acidobacteriota bacterium]
MTNRLWLTLGLSGALSVLALTPLGYGQAPGGTAAAVENTAAVGASIAPPFPIPRPYPFTVGEKLTYEFSFSRFPLYGKLGELELAVVAPETVRETMDALASKLRTPETAERCPAPISPPVLVFQAQARTRGFLPALLRLDIRNDYLSIVDAADLGLVHNERALRSRRWERLQMTCQARTAALRTILERDGDAASPVKVRTLPSRGWTTDLQTFWHVLRTQPLTPGVTIPMVLTEDDRIYDIPVLITNEVETITTRAGRFRARKLDLKAYEAGFTRYQGTFFLWLTEDAARLPVRVRFRARGVTVTGDLVRYTPPRSGARR